MKLAGRQLPDSARRDAWFALALFAVALLPRIYIALYWAKEPVWDGHYYHFGATRIAEGLGYSEDVIIDGHPVWKPWCHYPVGYSGMLGLVYKVFGSGLWVAPLTNALIGALTVVCLYGLARHFLCPVRSKIAGVLCAFHPGLVAYTALLMTEPLSAFSIVLAGLFAAHFRTRKLGWIGSGISLGLGTLVRPTALLSIPWLAGFYARGRNSGSRLALLDWLAALRQPRQTLSKLWIPIRVTLLAATVAMLSIAPWTVRNCVVMDGCALVSTNGGWNLAIGAMTETGRFTALKAEWGCPGPGQVKQDRCWAEVGRRKIAEAPLRWLSMIPQKLQHTYNHESFVVGYLGEADPRSWPEERKDSWRTLLTVFHHLLMLAAALSVAAPRWRRLDSSRTPERAIRALLVQSGLMLASIGFALYALSLPESPLYWLIVLSPLVAFLPLPGAPRLGPVGAYAWGAVLMTSVTHGIFFGDDRYHLTVSPLLCLLAAGALRSPAPPKTPTAQRS